MQILFILWHHIKNKFCWLNGTQITQTVIQHAFLCSYSCPHRHVFITTNSKVSLIAKSQFLRKLEEKHN